MHFISFEPDLQSGTSIWKKHLAFRELTLLNVQSFGTVFFIITAFYNFVVLWLRKLRNYHEMYMNSKHKKLPLLLIKPDEYTVEVIWKEFFQGNGYQGLYFSFGILHLLDKYSRPEACRGIMRNLTGCLYVICWQTLKKDDVSAWWVTSLKSPMIFRPAHFVP